MLPIHFRRGFLCGLLSFAFLLPLAAQKRLNLDQAVQQKLVRIAVKGLGGFQGESLKIMLQNLSDEVLIVDIPAGQIFASEDSALQDLMVTQDALLAMGAGDQKMGSLMTMCTQSYNMAPQQGDRFRLGPMAQEALLRLAQKISRKGYQNSTAQSAVWCLANQESIRTIYGSDTAMVRDIAETVSEATGVHISNFLLRPRPHQIISIRSSLEALIERPLTNARLLLVDSAGQRVRTYFEGRKLERGFRQFKVGASHTLGEDAQLFLRLMEGEELIAERSVSPSDSVIPLWHLHQQLRMLYEVKEPVEATIGVYDAQDRLYFLVREGHPLHQGQQRGTYIAGCYLPEGQQYFMKVRANGKTLASKAIDPQGAPPLLNAKQKMAGQFNFEVEEALHNARIEIYTADGERYRLLYEIHNLNPGKKHIRYQFEHFEGPEAVFYIRLLNQENRILSEQELIQR